MPFKKQTVRKQLRFSKSDKFSTIGLRKILLIIEH